MEDQTKPQFSNFDEEIRFHQARIAEGVLALGVAAREVTERLQLRLKAAREVATRFSKLGTPWGDRCREQLDAAIKASEINREDREGKILLGLPKTTEAFPAWSADVVLVDANSDRLGDAASYGLDRMRELSRAATAIADSIAAIDEPATQDCFRGLRELADLKSLGPRFRRVTDD
jgi:hypothetical protein